MTVIAVPEAPPIICPSWCVVPESEHVADLPNWDGVAVHWSAGDDEQTGWSVRIASTTYVDGTPDESEPMHLFIEDPGYHEGATLGQAEAFVRQILATVEEARR